MNLILIGPQGSGKGTQAEMLAAKYNLAIVEMGRLLRQVAKENTLKGKMINKLINKQGKLVPDGITLEIIEEHLKQIDWKQGLVLDGFPRTIKQFYPFLDYLSKKKQNLNVVIYLRIPEELTIKRLSNRLTCTLCGEIYNLETNPPPQKTICKCGGKLIHRKDDNPEAIKQRLSWSREETKPLLKLFKKMDILVTIDGSHRPDEVFKLIQAELERKGLVKS